MAERSRCSFSVASDTTDHTSLFGLIHEKMMLENELHSRIMAKLQLLSILPLSEVDQRDITISKSLLNLITQENATLGLNVKELQEIFDLKENIGPSEGTAIPNPYMEGVINLSDFSNDNGIIKQTRGYQDINPDGTAKPVTLKQLELFNFQTLFNGMLAKISYPSLDVLETEEVVTWGIENELGEEKACLCGPGDSTAIDKTFGEVASGEVVSLYPQRTGRPYREGDPICDRYILRMFENSVIVCLTDGCNWGDKPRKASRLVNKALVQYMIDHISSIHNVLDVVHALIASAANSHFYTIEGPEEQWMGKTTANIGMLLKVDNKKQEEEMARAARDQTCMVGASPEEITSPYVFVCLNIGDCKALCFSKRSGCVVDITSLSRSNPLNPSDPGGRLGPYKDAWPDLRNIAAFWHPVEEGDIIALISDGIHDNLDPQIQGLAPRDLGLDFQDWAHVPTPWVVAAKSSYLCHYVKDLFKGELITPRLVKDKLIHCSLDTSRFSRTFLEKNPSSKVPPNYAEFPGKMDHSSIICFRAGYITDGTILHSSHVALKRKRREVHVERSQTIASNSVTAIVRQELAGLKGILDSPPGKVKFAGETGRASTSPITREKRKQSPDMKRNTKSSISMRIKVARTKSEKALGRLGKKKE